MIYKLHCSYLQLAKTKNLVTQHPFAGATCSLDANSDTGFHVTKKPCSYNSTSGCVTLIGTRKKLHALSEQA